jgi:hypothetical protein
MARRRRPFLLSVGSIARPVRLKVLSAAPKRVQLQWEHRGGAGVMFQIWWSKGDGFIPMDEVTATRARTSTPGVYRFTDRLPTSGTSRYFVRASTGGTHAPPGAFFNESWELSRPSGIVAVTIKGPAAGDIDTPPDASSAG